MKQSEKVIFDCDNTLGLANCDVDDGLALLYLLGQNEIELLGVTLTYGNSTLAAVTQQTELFWRYFSPIVNYYPGQEKTAPDNQAAHFLAEQVQQFPGEITILATGALTNLAQAAVYYPQFFQQVKRIVLMGGITKPLLVQSKLVSELNFSCDAAASQKVIFSAAPLTILNGHLTKQALFKRQNLPELVQSLPKVAQRDFVQTALISWLTVLAKEFQMDGFCNWDVAAAIYLCRPDLFRLETVVISETESDLKTGRLKINQGTKTIQMPSDILDLETFNHHFCEIINQLQGE